MDVFILSCEDKSVDSIEYLDYLREIYLTNCEDYRIIMCKNRDEIMIKTLYYKTRDDVRYIYAIGGNETVNSVINGMIPSKKPLVIIPCGNNDLARNLEKLESDTWIDLGRVNGEYFLNNVSVGLDALISKRINDMSGLKNPSYTKELLRLSSNYSSFDVKMNLDGDVFDKNINLASFYNGPYLGNTKMINDGSIIDGKLNLFLSKDTTRLRLFYNLLKMWLMDAKNSKDIILREVEKAHLNFDYPCVYTFDGIEKRESDLNISVCPKKILIKKELDPRIRRLSDGKNCK